MNPKRIIIVGTMAIAITIGGVVWSDETSAHVFGPLNKSNTTKIKTADLQHNNEKICLKDDMLQALGVSSDEEIYDALYNGKSLADIAEGNHVEVQSIIDLQIAELTDQLDSRLANGSITPNQYLAQKSELTDIITDSVFGKANK